MSSLSSETEGLRQRRPEETAQASQSKDATELPHSEAQRERILRQMYTEERLQMERRRRQEELRRQRSWRGMIWTSLKILVVLLVVVVAGIFFLRPTLLFDDREKLPMRNLFCVFPDHIKIKLSLPRFFQNYALVTPENEPARRQVQVAAELRSKLSYPGREHRQLIMVHAWEHDDFRWQLSKGDSMDQVCDEGFRAVYDGIPSRIPSTTTLANASLVTISNTSVMQERYRDLLLSFCLIKSGSHDGYVAMNVRLDRTLNQGLQGVAAKYLDQDRLHTGLLIVPILSQAERALPLDQRKPSTMLPGPALRYLIDHPIENADDLQDFEEYLYALIHVRVHASAKRSDEIRRWKFLQAACTANSRAELDRRHLRMGTTCSPSSNNSDHVKEEKCCSFYDPDQAPVPER